MNRTAPAVAVIVPSYGHPSLMIDAVESALRQEGALPFGIVLVNDGCSLRQTDSTCRAYARAHADRILYVHKTNGGLSSARNRGIAVALQAWPQLDAFYFLDADNRLSPRLLEKSYAQLQAHPEADWVFPDFLMFGSQNDYLDSGGPFNRLQFLMQNYCDAASLVRRRVFDAGSRFDETMKLGFEDWDFWLQCVQAGRIGVHGHALGFLYRKRPESMLANSGRDYPQIVGSIRRKHAALFNLRQAMTLAAKEFPRFAVYHPETGEVAFTSDWQKLERLTWSEFTRRLRRWRDSRRVEHCPATVIVAPEAALALLRERGLTANLLWLLEADLEDHPLAGLHISQGVGVSPRTRMSDSLLTPLSSCTETHLCAIRLEHLEQCLHGPDAESWDSLRAPAAGVRWLHLEHSGRPRDLRPTALEELRELVELHRSAYRKTPVMTMVPPRRTMRPPFEPDTIIRNVFQTPLPPPVRLPPGTRSVGFLVPDGEAGAAVGQLARLVQARGWRTHLFVAGGELNFAGPFDSTHLVPDVRLQTPARLVSLMGTMDAVVSCRCELFHTAAGELKRLGVKLMSYLQGPDGGPDERPHSAIDYEHALHKLLAVSKRQATWLAAWGVPREKIIELPLGPGLSVPDVRIEQALAERAQRTPGEPLRVLCELNEPSAPLLERLARLVRGFPAEWRFLSYPPSVPPAGTAAAWEPLAPHWHTLSTNSHSRTGHYAWADVLLAPETSPSPLTLLDAQQLGCVPVATGTTAVEDVIEADRTGFLIKDAEWTDTVVARLNRLQVGRAALLVVARQGAEHARGRGWEKNAAAWIGCLEGWFGGQGG